MGIMQVWN